ncbi:MAG: hypothetical protein QOJ47_2294, partial [Gaiellales bacterium]|nr:hypothetical protein [Gaiellales bacterium]
LARVLDPRNRRLSGTASELAWAHDTHDSR